MPEVIEVLRYADFIRLKLKNKPITEVKILNGRYHKHGDFEGYSKLSAALPLIVKDVHTKGKFLYIEFVDDLWLLSTLGLSGGWTWESRNRYEFPSIVKYLDSDSYHQRVLKHLNVEFKTAHGSLFYYDLLSFGTLKVADKATLDAKLAMLGPDITTVELPEFKARLAKVSTKPIGTVLMNQRLISGIGNYLRADLLWLSKISPFRTVQSLSATDQKHLWEAARFLVWSKYDYKKGLKTGVIRADHPKLPYDYGREFYVYMQTTDPQGRPVKKEELYTGSQKRFIHWVPAIQK